MLNATQDKAAKKTKWAHKLVLLGVLTAIIIGGQIIYKNASRFEDKPLRIKNVGLDIERADSDAERRRGLCCRDYLDANSGMIFIYDKPGNYRFWMKDTKIALDMYWINSDKKVVHIEKNVQPSSYPKSFGTNAPAQYILETNAGFADRHNIKVGDKAEF